MRITNNMLVNNMINNIGKNLVRMDKYQNQMATGKKISVPSDDPVIAARALKLRTDVAEVDQYKRNAKDAQSWLDITESAIGSVGDVLQRTRELTVEASNGTNTPDDTKKIAEEIKQLKTQMMHIANTTYAGRYVFSGYKTDQKLINDDENSPNFGAFNISVTTTAERIKYEIGIGDDININVPGGDLFNNAGNANVDVAGITTGFSDISNLTIAAGVNDKLKMTVDNEEINVTIPPATYADNNALASAIETAVNSATTGTDVTVAVAGNKLQFTTATANPASGVIIDSTSSAAKDLGLEMTTDNKTPKMVQDFNILIGYLNSGNSTGISSVLGEIDSSMDNMLRVRADIGARQNRVELTSNRLESDTVNFTKLMSENEDVDMAETIMNLQNEENVYKASLAGGAKIIQPTLVDFLR